MVGLDFTANIVGRRAVHRKDPEKQGWLKYDKEKYIEIKQQEAQKSIELTI